VSKSFAGITAVDRVSFRARAGEVTGFLGPNEVGCNGMHVMPSPH